VNFVPHICIRIYCEAFLSGAMFPRLSYFEKIGGTGRTDRRADGVQHLMRCREDRIINSQACVVHKIETADERTKGQLKNIMRRHDVFITVLRIYYGRPIPKRVIQAVNSIPRNYV